MKKTFKLLSVLALALAVVGCENEPIDEGNTPAIPEEPSTEEPADPTEPTELVLRATLPSTRTTLNEDYTVSWAKGDQLAVFYAPAGTTEYSDALEFTIDEELTGKFTPKNVLNLPDGDYDWFVCLPYNTSKLTTPAGQSGSDGYFPIGAANQSGYNNSEHIALNDIMVGKATETRTPKIALKHLAVLHKFTVTNKSNTPIVINKLTLNGGANKIFGTFWVDLTAEEPAIDINKANASFEERALTVKNGTELAKGKSADFYMITAPFTLNAGDVFKITIETNKGSQTLEKTAPSTFEFKAGTYNTANLVYDYVVTNDHLYYEKFDTKMTVSTSTSFDASTIGKYNNYKDGTSVYYDNDTANINYTSDGTNTCLSKNSVSGVSGTYVWFRKNVGGYIQVDGIKLHGRTNLVLSYAQQCSSGGAVKASYAVDSGEWTEFEVTSTTTTHEFEFSVLEGAQTISLRFTEAGSNNVRIDNIKLTWQE